MTLEELYYVSQIVAVVAIFGSLVYVAIQTRQNSQLIRAKAIWDAQTSIAEINDRLADGGPISQLNYKLVTNPDGLTGFETYQLHRHFRAVVMRTEAQFALHRNGILDAEVWHLRRRWFRGLLNYPTVMEIWQAEKANSVVTRAFIEEMETAAAADSAVLMGIQRQQESTERDRQ